MRCWQSLAWRALGAGGDDGERSEEAEPAHGSRERLGSLLVVELFRAADLTDLLDPSLGVVLPLMIWLINGPWRAGPVPPSPAGAGWG